MIKPLPFLFKLICACLGLLLFCAIPAVSQKRPAKKNISVKKTSRTLKTTKTLSKKEVLAAPRKIIVHDIADTVITSSSGSFNICQGTDITLTANHATSGDTVKWYKDN